MRAFISYASSDRAVASLLATALQDRGFTTFFDKTNLPAGVSFDKLIEREIAQCDIFIFLISPDSIQKDRYSMLELNLVERRWPNADKRALPVIIRETPIEALPRYLRSVTILQPVGNFGPEIASAALSMLDGGNWARLLKPLLFMLAAFVAVVVGAAALHQEYVIDLVSHIRRAFLP